MARKAVDQLLEGPKVFMQGPAGEAVIRYANGTQSGERHAFDTECLVLCGWVKQSNVGFAPIINGNKPNKRMVGPYLISEQEGGEKVPLHIQEGGDFGELRQQARIILKQHKPDSMDALVAAASERKRTYEQIKATDLYCAAVVQHSAQIEQMPAFLDYIKEVCPKRQSTECAMDTGGEDRKDMGGGNGEENDEA